MMTLTPIFETYKDEGNTIGRLLVGYSELEISLMFAAFAARDDFDEVFKAMYRSRGEKQRIDVADALGRWAHEKLGTGNDFSVAIGAMHHCRVIRNQYAHTNWVDAAGGILKFTNLESTAKLNSKVMDFKKLPIHHLNLALLKLQEEYFQYTKYLLGFLEQEATVLRGDLRLNPFSRPKPLAQPSLYMP